MALMQISWLIYSKTYNYNTIDVTQNLKSTWDNPVLENFPRSKVNLMILRTITIEIRFLPIKLSGL